MPEELLAALSFADIGGTGGVPPWALGGPEWDQENGGLTETHIKVELCCLTTIAWCSVVWCGVVWCCCLCLVVLSVCFDLTLFAGLGWFGFVLFCDCRVMVLVRFGSARFGLVWLRLLSVVLAVSFASVFFFCVVL